MGRRRSEDGAGRCKAMACGTAGGGRACFDDGRAGSMRQCPATVQVRAASSCSESLDCRPTHRERDSTEPRSIDGREIVMLRYVKK